MTTKAQIREEVRILRAFLRRFEVAVAIEHERDMVRWAEQVQNRADRISALIEQWGRERTT